MKTATILPYFLLLTCLAAGHRTLGMEIFVQAPDFAPFQIDVEGSDTIFDVKSQLQDRIVASPNEQAVFFAGRLLEDNRTLGDYNIQKESTLRVYPSLFERTFSTGISWGVASTQQIRFADYNEGLNVTRSIIDGLLDLSSASAEAPINLSLVTFAFKPGALNNFDNELEYAWVFAQASSGIADFSADKFVIGTQGFLNDCQSGEFFIPEVGNSLVLNFSPVPEPQVLVLIFIGAILLIIHRKRKSRTRPAD